MRKLLKVLVLLLVTNCVFATDYYISNTGNDVNDGRSTATAWRTLTKLNSSWASIVSGDRIFFERGGTFSGNINVTKSGVTLGSYGTGAKPIITGFHTVTTWTSAGNNRWTTTIPTSLNFTRLLTVNGQITRVGRFPNYAESTSAWIRYTNTPAQTSPTTVTSATAIATNLVDGELVLFKNNWNLDVMPITGISGNNITCTNPAGMWGIAGVPYGGSGFFVQNSINALDQNNEWHFSNSTKVLTLFSTTNPSDREVKIPTVTNLITLGSTSNIVIDGLDIQGAAEKGIICSGGSNITIRNCVVRYIQGWAMDLRSSNMRVENNLIRDIGSNGVWFGGSGTITGNTLKRVGAWEGLPGLTTSGAGTQGNQDDQYEGILLQSSNGITCSLNNIDSTGYNGIKHYGSNITIEKNVINFPCVTKSDGGGIYCWDNDGTLARTNRRVKNNIILNSGKFLYGVSTPGLNTASYGIYFDGGSNGALCDSNVIGPNVYSAQSNCPGVTNTTDDAGLMLNGGTNLTLRGNIVFGWPDALEIWKPSVCCVPSNNRIVGNALYVNGGGTDLCTWNQSLQYHRIDNSTIPQLITQVQALGFIDSNFVSSFAPSPFTYKSQAANPGGPVSLATWRTNTGKDLNSTSFPNTTPDFQYNATNTPRTYSFPGLSKKDFRGVVYNNSAVIPPYYGNIFFPNGNATGGTPLSATSTATAIACNGGNSTVTVAAAGGTTPYTGTGTFTRTAGIYTFTVTDAAGGSTTTSITITQPTALVAANPTAPAITSVGGTTTITQPAPTGGTAPFTYQLGTGAVQTTNTWSGIVAGSYTITIRDACSTTITRSITITAPPVIVINVLDNLGLTNTTPSAVAYSVRKLSSTYNGPVMQIRRSNDNELRDVYFNGSGVLALNSTVSAAGGGVATTTTLGSWIGVNSGTVAIWYDQSGNGRNITAAAANQPLIIQSGSILTNPAGYPRVQFNGSTTYLTSSTFVPTTQPVSLSGVWQFTSLTTPGTELCGWGNNAGAGSRIGAWIGFVNSTQGRFGIETAGTSRMGTTVINTNSWNITSQVIPTNNTLSLSQRLNRVNETLTGTGAIVNITSTGSVFAVGTVPGALGAHTLNGSIQELVLFQSELPTTDRITMENNQTTYYIPASTSPLLSTALAPAILCSGGTTTITVTATGGTPPYTGTGTFVRPAGTHTFTITDAAGVTATSVVTLTDPPALIVTANATPITCVGGNSTIVIGASGGTPPYTGTGTFTRTAGTHTFVVVDANGCSITTTITVNDPQVVTPTVTIGSVVSPGSVVRINQPVIISSPTTVSDMSVVIFPNPTTGRFNLDLKTNSNKTVSIFVYSLEGRIVFQASGAPKNRYIFGSSLIAGMYTVKVIQGEDVRVIEVIKGE